MKHKKILLPKAAKDLLKRGFFIFPTLPGRKGFYRLKWSKERTNDPVKVSEWAHSEEYGGCNWGVACGPSGLVVLDIDGETGEESLEKLELVWGDLPDTLVCRTASGGRHLYFRGQARSTTSIGWKGSRLDSRSTGGMAFSAGSVIGDGIYNWELDVPIAECPQWLVNLIGEAREREKAETAILAEDSEADITRAEAWLKDQPPAIANGTGEPTTFAIMQVLRDFGLSVDKCAELAFKSKWNEQSSPPWSFDELRKKAANAASYSHGDQGSRSVTVEFSDESIDQEREADEDQIVLDPLLVEMNRKHSKQLLGGKLVIWCQEQSEISGKFWVPCPTAEFDKIYEHQVKELGHGGTVCPVSKWWRRHPKHMRSLGTILDPDKPPGPTGLDKPFNLWCGWGIAPLPGDSWVDYERLIVESLCAGVRAHADYVLNWCALLIQRPTELPKVSVVFRGRRGTGKSTLGLALVDALGPHAVKVDQLSAVTGQFNWHLKNKVFLLAEEIRWLSERGAEGVLKSLITDYHKGYEAKGVNMVDGYNYLSVMMNSNSEWVVPASLQDERRFAVFDVDERLRADTAFWKRLYTDQLSRLKKEPIAAFLAALKKRDISKFDPIRDAPKTQALTDQAIESLNYIEQWWFGKIEQRMLPGIDKDWSDSQTNILAELVYQDYLHSTAGKWPKSRHAFGRQLSNFGVQRTRIRNDNGKREYCYSVPSLDVSRSHFFQNMTHSSEED